MRGARIPALTSAKRACELAPADPRSWSDLGRVYAMFGELPMAVNQFAEAIKADQGHADSWHNLGTALKKLGDHRAAFSALKTALQLEPTRAESYVNLGNLLIEAGQLEDAVECFERAAQHDPQLAAARSHLAEQLSQRGDVHKAETLFRQAVGLDPDQVQGWFGLGRTLEDLGDADNALACYRQVLQRRPDHPQALGQYLALIREAAADEALEYARSTLSKASVADEAKALIGYGLAKYHDRRNEFAAAAAAGITANEARRRAAGPLNRERLQARIDGLIATYDAEFFATRRRFGAGTDQPIFIVGLPRSGTTLCEQILSSHPQIHGAGELPDLARLAARTVEGTELPPWQAALQLTESKSLDFATQYSKALRNGAPKGCARISDKSPLNFFQLAFAALLFPNARVIHCKRDARDNAFSIWLENFNPDQGYATDFHDLAFFHAEYQRLMAHWQRALPLPILEVQYEGTVSNVEAQARRLLEFVDLPWDDRCLDFHRNERAVQTPSRWQVRQPIYSKSVGKWRHYAPHLTELLAAFRD
ncbi:tetratricopeptide repeat-containing sulfotransferase family protein [Steroidobacter cummioxidans]|uniref:tetratricopeptide repeat-containing sulfotransferase family protein n=1 Tax=Steroidobacter cummioxidans TaxID=1803913 RepID=UPI0013795D29|nr:sulfotransferase [Steroidobacter cummioxidans]